MLHQHQLDGNDGEPWKGICCHACWNATQDRCACRCGGKYHGMGHAQSNGGNHDADDSKTYHGIATGSVVGAKQVLVNGQPLTHVVKHSPDGFNWGYGGSGPADLAYAILNDLYGKTVADRLYQPFKQDVIATLPQGEAWTLTGAAIDEWKHQQETS